MTPLLLLTLCAGAPLDGYEIVVRRGEKAHRVGLTIDTPDGPLPAREAKLLAGWKPSDDGSDPLDRLLPDGRLLRVELAKPSPHAGPITRALFAALDRDGDGRITPDELKDAEKVLLKRFDVDGDGCLTPLEIAPDLLTREASVLKDELTIAVRQPGDELPRGISGKALRLARLTVGSAKRMSLEDGLRFDIVSAAPSPIDVPATPRSLSRPGKEKDRTRFEQVARSVVTLTIRPEARGWFEILDADGDGQLSVRELRGAWDRLADDGARKAGFLTLPDFSAPVVSATLAPGAATRPAVPLVKKPRPARGPEWFRAMDGNGDGDLSRDEFLGTDEEFRAYDADGDGLISVAEASKRGRP